MNPSDDNSDTKAINKALKKGDMEALGRALSHRQRRFAEEYIIDFNGAAAAVRAGYSPNYPDRQAHQLLRRAGIAAYIDHLSKTKEQRIQSVNPEWVVQKVIKNIETAEDRANLSAVFRGLELMARHLGMLKDKTEISGPDGEAIRIEQRVQEESEDFMRAMKRLRERAEEAEEKTEVTPI